jgi:hypothetical protein
MSSTAIKQARQLSNKLDSHQTFLDSIRVVVSHRSILSAHAQAPQPLLEISNVSFNSVFFHKILGQYAIDANSFTHSMQNINWN